MYVSTPFFYVPLVMKLTIQTRDILLAEHFEDWKLAYTTKDKKLMYTVQLRTVKFHNQKCGCATAAVMNKLKTYYIKMDMY